MRPGLLALALLVGAAMVPDFARALDKVNPYICPTKAQGSGLDCFLEAVPQTYTMCRHVKSIEIIEFGLEGAQQGVNGAKTESCIEKHKILIVRPYQAAVRESAHSKPMVQKLRQLYDLWLDSLAKLLPAAGETDEGYKQRVVRPYGEFNEQIQALRVLAAEPAKPPAAKSKKPNI
jgi:hypothetical protein